MLSGIPKLVVHVLSIIPGTLENSFFSSVYIYTLCLLEVTPRLCNFRDEGVGCFYTNGELCGKSEF